MSRIHRIKSERECITKVGSEGLSLWPKFGRTERLSLVGVLYQVCELEERFYSELGQWDQCSYQRIVNSVESICVIVPSVNIYEFCYCNHSEKVDQRLNQICFFLWEMAGTVQKLKSHSERNLRISRLGVLPAKIFCKNVIFVQSATTKNHT